MAKHIIFGILILAFLTFPQKVQAQSADLGQDRAEEEDRPRPIRYRVTEQDFVSEFNRPGPFYWTEAKWFEISPYWSWQWPLYKSVDFKGGSNAQLGANFTGGFSYGEEGDGYIGPQLRVAKFFYTGNQLGGGPVAFSPGVVNGNYLAKRLTLQEVLTLQVTTQGTFGGQLDVGVTYIPLQKMAIDLGLALSYLNTGDKVGGESVKWLTMGFYLALNFEVAAKYQ